MLTLAVALSLLILPAGAASTPEEALGEVNIYSGGYSMNYLPSTAGCRPSRIPTSLPQQRRGDAGNPSLLCNARPVRRTTDGS